MKLLLPYYYLQNMAVYSTNCLNPINYARKYVKWKLIPGNQSMEIILEP